MQVDEHQDTNPLQDRLLRLLAGERANLMVVGDDAQAIYALPLRRRAQHPALRPDYPRARVVRPGAQLPLHARRSCGAANRLIAHSPTARAQTMVAQAPAGPEPVVRAHASEEAEARWAAATVARAVARGIAPGEVAVLARAKGVLGGVEAALVGARVPYRMLSGTALHARREVKAALAHLTLLVNPRDAEAFSRVMLDARRGIGEVTVARVDAHAVSAEHQPARGVRAGRAACRASAATRRRR